MSVFKKLKDLTGGGNLVKYCLLLPLTIPHYFCFLLAKEKNKIREDVEVWMRGNNITFFY